MLHISLLEHWDFTQTTSARCLHVTDVTYVTRYIVCICYNVKDATHVVDVTHVTGVTRYICCIVVHMPHMLYMLLLEHWDFNTIYIWYVHMLHVTYGTDVTLWRGCLGFRSSC